MRKTLTRSTKSPRNGKSTDVSDTLGLSKNAITVLENRYLDRDDQGRIKEDPAELFRRVARAVSQVENKWGATEEDLEVRADQFFDLMASGRFMPNSPTLMNAGRRLGMLSACFVLPLEDSIPGIMETARQIALVQRAGGGTGVDLSSLRPRGAIVRSSGGTTEGPLSFLQMLSSVTDAIQQGAFRRGANMGMMRIDHPDVLNFIRIKEDLAKVTNYNLSVSMSDLFMKQLREDASKPHIIVDPQDGTEGWIQRDSGDPDYDPNRQEGTSDSKYWTVQEVWDLIVDKAWGSGEPGLIFIDEVNRHNQTPNAFEMVATNPCGEQPLGPYEACNLGSINLAKFLKVPAAESKKSKSLKSGTLADRGVALRNAEGASLDERIDWDALGASVCECVRFLDDVVEANNYPTPEIHEACHANRKIGLGVMGWADMLFTLGVGYDSEEALDLARKVGGFIQKTAWDADSVLAEERGVFPNWEGSIWDKKHKRKMRNAHCVTIAPTGTISIIAGCSGGIEPIFSLAFTRQVLDGKTLTEVNPIFEASLERYFEGDKAKVEEVVKHVAAAGTIQDLDLPETIKGVFRTARDIEPDWHVRMQAAWQEHTDAAVSKTINLPSDASREEVESAYLLAYETKCKGITVYRDGSRSHQPMALAKDKESEETETEARNLNEIDDEGYVVPMKLPAIMPCVRIRQLTPFGNMHVKISVEPKTGAEREVFAQLGKGGDVANSDLEAVCRILSLFLRCNGSLKAAVCQLDGIGSSLSVPSRDGRIMSLADGLAEAIKKYLHFKEQKGIHALLLGEVDFEKTIPSENKASGSQPFTPQSAFKVKCPSCNGVLAFQEGCVKCHACGFSQC